MKLDRCKNGHIYDVSRYSSCPYCKSEGLETEVLEDKINLVEEMEDEVYVCVCSKPRTLLSKPKAVLKGKSFSDKI